MSVLSLCNNKCSWVRKTDSDPVERNDWGERKRTDRIVNTDIPCRVEKFSKKDLIEHAKAGDTECAYFYLYLPSTSYDIKPNDVVTFVNTIPDIYNINGDNDVVVEDIDDAAGHGNHLEVLCYASKGVK